MKPELVDYILMYFPHLMTEDERETLRYNGMLLKLAAIDDGEFRKKLTAKLQETGWTLPDESSWMTVIDGNAQFRWETAVRILTERRDDVHLNNCPKCGLLARTPRAQQCRSCGHQWR